ncbi:S8 family serine peptidase [Rhizobium ruizarguesonis]|uniref:S8 family serine peptidase n=1 Tax=Rhizobium ruizarguesonis TaxID=2081791 RepID=UPI0010327BDF|nr:S8 family serine peptidase [Rhizobium ruizarguesonis]TBA52714.1 serine protease [Rhizobium ruizarguesonis]
MSRIFKAYDAKPEALAGLQGVKVLERYPAFTTVEAADDDAAAAVMRSGLTEDISEEYTLSAGLLRIPTNTPRVNAKGQHESHPTYTDDQPLPPGSHHYIVQFVGPVRRSWLQGLEKTGAEVVAPYEHFAIIANATAQQAGTISSLRYVRWVGHLPYEARLAPDVERPSTEPPENAPRTRVLPDAFTVQFFKPEQARRARRAVSKAGFDLLEDASESAILVVKVKRPKAGGLEDKLTALSQVHGVERVSRRTMPRISNDRAAVVMGVSTALGSPAPALGLSGSGEIIAICDTGLDNGDQATIHPDFTGRVLAIKSYPVAPSYTPYIKNPGADDGPADVDSGHGTHTSGSILGDGASSSNLPGLAGPIRGLAYRANLVMQAVEQFLDWRPGQAPEDGARYGLAGLPSDLSSLFSWAYSKGARIHSNSWGGGTPQGYNAYCTQVDAFIWNKPDFCVLFAAGNDGEDRDMDGRIDLGSVTPPGTAKNCITVGACANDRPNIAQTNGDLWGPEAAPVAALAAGGPDQLAPFSSRGPTRDGRIKPDVVAPGTYVLSTRSRKVSPKTWGYGRYETASLYMFDCGTSMATPLTAGAVAIIREYLRTKSGIATPSAALLKAALIAGAVPLNGAPLPPDNNQGFGRVNIDGVVAPVSPLRSSFVEGPRLATGQLNETVVEITNSDHVLRVVLAYSDYPGPNLVNNLNLILRGPDGTVFTGNDVGTQSFDKLNNVELVSITSAIAGSWKIQVVGSNVPRGPQPFALAIIAAS